MYNFNLLKDEKLIEIFENVLISQKQNEKTTTIALTNQRILFLDYITNDGHEALRITGRLNLVRTKEVYYEINLKNILSIQKIKNKYIVTTKDNESIIFDNAKLFKLLSE